MSVLTTVITIAISGHENPAKVFEDKVNEFFEGINREWIVKVYSTMTDHYFYFFCAYEVPVVGRYGVPD